MASPRDSMMTTAQDAKKRKVSHILSPIRMIEPAAQSLAIIPVVPQVQMDDAEAMAELLYRERARIELDINPAYISRLESRREIGFYPPVASKNVPFTTFNIDVAEFRRCITHVLTAALKVRYYDRSNLRNAEINTEINTIVPRTVSACMCAVYAKLRSIHRTHGTLRNRYVTTPTYNKDIELPLPLAIAIQGLGAFRTESILANRVIAPTYPEATQYEGRAQDAFNMTEYQNYIPTLKDLGIPCKSVEIHDKKGTAWWSYKIHNDHGTSDLVCLLPPTNYSPLAVATRMLFLATQDDSDECTDFIEWPEDLGDYGTQLKEAPPNSNVRAFLALCHGPLEEWSNGHA
ncbi:putative coat protein [Fragaria chiloensis cryptic virus]|uniref:putative coat protein n=1 Tax=Fragaria chiloensis cryptic virus TaxID=335204 RepID=UPI0001509022|nr:putative coat protein [Fragaria chiloensis cryptic virus]ABC73695.1 putative coat protein [Fragaria chiloensis cryptic virus]